jgi:hypothetical protein
VNSNEFTDSTFEQSLEGVHPLGDEMGTFSGVNACVVADGLDPIDRLDFDDDRLRTGADADAFRWQLPW